MFKTYKSQSSRKVSRKKHTPDESLVTQSSAPQHPTLQMQSLVGNHATQQMIQRMPTHGAIIGKLGQPKADVKAFGKVIKQNATKYHAVLNAVQAYDRYLVNTTLAVEKSGKQSQFQAALNLLDTILRAIAAYDGKKDAKALYFARMKPQVEAEKNKVAVSMVRVISKPVDYSLTGQPKFGNVLRGDTPVSLNERDKVGGERGGTSEVSKMGGSNPGYFKENKETLENWSDDGEAYMRITAGKKGEEGFNAWNTAQNEKAIGVDLVGIDATNARMAKRDVAMSRLDQLLGGNVIAKAELAVMHSGDGKKSGSLMEDATKKGKSAFNVAKGGSYDPGKGGVKGDDVDSINLQDPQLMRQLSRLQLIDLLAFQVDRNTKNYYIQTDKSGNVVGIVGIDNDFSLGTNTDVEGKNQELPGLSRYVDEELANAILNLDVEMLKSLMYDLLSEAEINALVERLHKLQVFLKPLKDNGQLLKSNQWTTAIAQNLLDEKMEGDSVPKSYYAQFVGVARGERKK